MRPPLALLLILVLALSACAGDAVPGQPASPTTTDTVEEIRALRAALAAPATAVGRAGQRLATAVEALRTDPGGDPEARLSAAAEVRTGPLTGLSEAIAAAEDVPVDPRSSDGQAVGAAWGDVLASARALRDAADAELELIGQLAAADVRLLAVTEVWDQPGSRNQQLNAFAEAAADADAVATELTGLDVGTSCLGDVQRRIAAATFVASATRELRRYVSAHQGNRFDARRAELSQDPFGLGGALAELPDAGCWSEGTPTGRASAALLSSLGQLEAALNPADLSTPSAG